MKSIWCCALVLASWALPCIAADDCDRCARCGCAAPCCKVCRCVPAKKKVPKITYEVECEDFCVPDKSEHSVTCDECWHKKQIYTPTCAKVYTRKKLIKREIAEEVPTTDWVVENLCHECATQCTATEHAEPAAVTPAANNSAAATLTPRRPSLAGATQPSAGRRTTFAARVKADFGRAVPGFFSQE